MFARNLRFSKVCSPGITGFKRFSKALLSGITGFQRHHCQESQAFKGFQRHLCQEYKVLKGFQRYFCQVSQVFKYFQMHLCQESQFFKHISFFNISHQVFDWQARGGECRKEESLPGFPEKKCSLRQEECHVQPEQREQHEQQLPHHLHGRVSLLPTIRWRSHSWHKVWKWFQNETTVTRCSGTWSELDLTGFYPAS